MKDDTSIVESISARLRRTEPSIEDRGFSNAVMAGMAHSRDVPEWKKNTLLLAATALGSAIVTSQLPMTVVPDLLAAAMADSFSVLGASIVVAYSAAIAAILAARRH